MMMAMTRPLTRPFRFATLSELRKAQMLMAMTRPLTRPLATLSPLRGARGNAGRVAQRGRGQQGPKFPLAPRERGEGGQRPGEGRVTLSREDGEGSLRHVHDPAPDPSPSSRLRMTNAPEH